MAHSSGHHIHGGGPHGDDRRGTTTDEPADWPPRFPHLAIDRLLDDLEHGRTVDPAESQRLLGLVAREAQRLRTTVARLSIDKLSDADREARAIVAEAQRHAHELRTAGLTALESRLEEAEMLLATMREAFRVELRASGGLRDQPGTGSAGSAGPHDWPREPR